MRKKSFALESLAKLTGAQLIGDPKHRIYGVEDLERASEKEISFLDNSKYLSKMKQSKAGAIFVSPEVQIKEGNFLVCEFPSLAFQKVIEKFMTIPPSQFNSIHETAIIGENVKIAEDVVIGPYAVIDHHVTIGKNTRIEAHCCIGSYSTIGSCCHLHPQVVLKENTSLGNRVIIGSSTVIGSCGFGYFTNPNTGKHSKLKQMGSVIIEDDVEIGSNTSIDRARFKATVIGQGSKIDNLVQIAHGVELGQDNLIASQTGIAGSTKTGSRVFMGGQVGVIGHIRLADDVILAARATPIKSLETKGVYTGSPATPLREYNEQVIYLKNLKKWVEKFKAFEKKISAFEQSRRKGFLSLFRKKNTLD